MKQFAHVECCIKEMFKERLSVIPDLTVECNKTDCWERAELNTGKAAVNIITGLSRPGDATTIDDPEHKGGGFNTPVLCAYKTAMDITVEIYVVGCVDSFCTAKSFESQVMPLMFKRLSGTTRTTWEGSAHKTQEEKSVDSTIITLSYELEYIFSPEKPWVFHT